MTERPAGLSNIVDVLAIDASTLPWQELHVEQIDARLPVKPLLSDPDTGMSVQIIRYPAGFTNRWHTHSAAHGMYVLDGVLRTHQGDFGPGSWVWFPEGGWMEHGAAESDTTFLFITNKAFDIHYTEQESAPYPQS